jgi:hypothetical protein
MSFTAEDAYVAARKRVNNVRAPPRRIWAGSKKRTQQWRLDLFSTPATRFLSLGV